MRACRLRDAGEQLHAGRLRILHYPLLPQQMSAHLLYPLPSFWFFAAHFVGSAFRALIRVALADYEFVDTFILVVKCAPTSTPDERLYQNMFHGLGLQAEAGVAAADLPPLGRGVCDVPAGRLARTRRHVLRTNLPFAPFVPAPQIASHHCVHPAFIPSGSDRADPFCSSALCPPPPRPPV